jgi:hypothetical protein
MILLRALLAAVVAATGLVLAAPAPAVACSCVTADPARLVRWADVVVVGELSGIAAAPERDVISSTDPVGYTIAVDRVLKGEAGGTVEVVSARFGASCGLEGLEVGRSYVVLAAHHDIMGKPTDELWASLCGGTAPASRSYIAELEAVTGPGRPPDPGEPPAGSGGGTSAGATDSPPGDEAATRAADVPVWAWAAGTALVLGGILLVTRRRMSGG